MFLFFVFVCLFVCLLLAFLFFSFLPVSAKRTCGYASIFNGVIRYQAKGICRRKKYVWDTAKKHKVADKLDEVRQQMLNPSLMRLCLAP